MTERRDELSFAGQPGWRWSPGPWFAPFTPLYGAAVLARRWAYDAGLMPVARPRTTTISVGGLEAGGSGKTPAAALLVVAFAGDGRRPGLVSRGYGRPTRDLRVRDRGEPARPEEIGDEPAMVVAGGADVAVAACPSRRRGAEALERLGVDVLVLDDGFQHRAIARDLDIVVLRGEAPFGTGHLLPWGTLREPPSSLGRAHVVWLHFRSAARLSPPPWLARLAPEALLVVSEAAAEPARDRHGSPVVLAGTRVAAAAGTARPDDFFASLARSGALIVAATALRDHHRYCAADATALAAGAVRAGAQALVVTPKDAVKLAPLWREAPPLWVVGTRPRIVLGAAALAARLGVDAAALAGP